MSPRAVFLHGRPAAHPFHAALARSIGADMLPIDFRLRWHDRPGGRLRRYASWLLCALRFPRRRSYEVFLSEGPHVLPVLMRRLGLLAPRQKTAALLAGEALPFLLSGRYPALATAGLRRVLRGYDALLCVGEMEAELARRALGPSSGKPRVLAIPGGLSSERIERLAPLEPALDGGRLLLVAAGGTDLRAWYKGLDLALEAYARARAAGHAVALDIAGEWAPAQVAAACSRPELDGVRFLGQLSDIEPVLRAASLYVHLGRGDAFPLAVLEAMCAGLPALVSDETGTREAVAQVDARLVVPAGAEAAAERIAWYGGLSPEHRRALSRRSREVARQYTSERAMARFREAVSGLWGPPQ